MADGCLVVAKPHPLSSDVVYCEFPSGMTIAEMLGSQLSMTARVECGGWPVPREAWPHVRPKAGVRLQVTLFPQGGNAGKWVRMVLLVVLMIYAPYLAPYLGYTGTAASLITAGVMIVGTLAINALIPPPSPKGLGGGGDPFQTLNSITGTSNQANPYGVIPCVVGTRRFFPPHAALPYTEISGNDQYLRMLLDLGYGDLDVSDLQIGETDIDSFEDVEYEISTAPTLFTQDIYELSVGATLDADTDYIRTSQDNSTELSVDFVFPQGLFAVNSKGRFVGAWIDVDIQFRKVGTTTWYGVADPTPGITISSGAMTHLSLSVYKIYSSANRALRCGIRWKVAAGQYEVKVQRNGLSWESSVQQSGMMVWSVMRSVSPQLPSTTGTTKLAVRIKATDQLNGVVQNLSVLAAQKVPQYDPETATWSANAESQNPAWIYAWMMTRCPAVMRRLADEKLDLDAIAEWAADCDAKGYKISFVMDSARAFGDILRDVLAAGRASFGYRNAKYSAVRDVAQTVPVQMFTPANSHDFSYARQFVDLPHALRVKFTNPEASNQQDYVTVYADGYDAETATRFEELDLSMVVDPNAAWRLGRYHLSVIYNRQTQYSFKTDLEHMVCERGDLVTHAHDITGWGLAWGRVKAVLDGGATIVLDEYLNYDTGKQYALRVRRQTGDQVEAGDVMGTVTWDSTLVSFDSTRDWDSEGGNSYVVAADPALDIQPGDLYVLGEVNQVVSQFLVRAIEPGDDLSATLTCVDAAPAVWTADAGTPPSFTSEITGTGWCSPPDDPDVNIRIGNSGPNDAGVIHAAPAVSGGPQGGIYRLPGYKQRQLEALQADL